MIQVRFFDGGSFAAHKIRHVNQFYSAYFKADGTLADLEHTGRWVMQGGIRINCRCQFETPRPVPLRNVKVRAAIKALGSRIHNNRDAYRV